MIIEAPISKKQKTLKNIIFFEGIGLHTGKSSKVKIFPAKEDMGIRFIRTDISKNNEIQAKWSNVSSTKLCTTISNRFDISISTIEHLMSALSGMHIDNAKIEVYGSEIPIMDGSSVQFVKLIEEAGIINQNKNRKQIKVLKKVKVEDKDCSISISPSEQFSVDFEIDFPSKVINKQSCNLKMINGNYKEDISKARTFGFEHEVDMLRDAGFARGGNLSNAIVVSENTILNKEGLRYKDEFVRHKILDSIGDLYLAGNPVVGYLTGKKSGHKLNNLLLKKLLANSSNWKYII